MLPRCFILICTVLAVSFAIGPQLAEGTVAQTQKTLVAPVVRAVTQGVVNIATKRIETLDSPLLRDPVFRELFDIPEHGLKRETQSAGSGVIVDAARGYVLTNDHVIKGASIIEVTTKDNRRFKAQLVGRDQATDIALLRPKAETIPDVTVWPSPNGFPSNEVLSPKGTATRFSALIRSRRLCSSHRTGLGIEGYANGEVKRGRIGITLSYLRSPKNGCGPAH